MDHAERTKLARDLASRMAARHGEAILVGGVYGSAARGDATPFSDLDMLFVVREGAAIAGRSFLFKDIAVALKVVDEQALEAEQRGPGADWPLWMGLQDVEQLPL